MSMRQIPLIVRAAQVVPNSINVEKRTIEVCWTTGATRLMWDPEDWFGGLVWEKLDTSPEACDLTRLNNRAPVLNGHCRWSNEDVLGVVEPGTARLDKGLGYATLRFDEDPVSDKIFQKMARGILNDVSVGYHVLEYEVKRSTVKGERDTWTAKKWRPYEISPVPVGADEGAKVLREVISREGQRSAAPLYLCQFTGAVRQESKELAMGGKKKPATEQVRAMPDDKKQSVRDILKEAGIVEERLDEYVDKLAALWPDDSGETKEGGDEARKEAAEALGCKEDATWSDIAKAAKAQRSLIDLKNKELDTKETEEKEDEFAANERKGLHRKLETVRKGYARELYETSPGMYRSEVARVKPLNQPAPDGKPETRTTISNHQDNSDKEAADIEVEEKRLLELNPKLDRQAAYKQAYKNVRARSAAK